MLTGNDDEEKAGVSTSYQTFHPGTSGTASGALSATSPPTHASSSRPKTKIAWLLLCMVGLAVLLSLAGLQRRPSDQDWLQASDDDVSPEWHRKHMIHVQHLEERHLPAPHDPKDGRGKRLVIVGDVHGCRSELKHLLRKVDFDERSDHLILAGDMINKGPDSHGVLTLARELGATCVRGNHEDKLLKSYFRRAEFPPTEQIKSLGDSLSKADIDYLLQCPLILSLGDVPSLKTTKAAVVHAGLIPHVKLEHQPPFVVMHMRTIAKHRRPSEERDGEPWWRVWNREQRTMRKRDRMTVIYGHDAKMGLIEKKYSHGLDTGCVKGGRLTALVLGGGKHEKEIVSVACGSYFD